MKFWENIKTNFFYRFILISMLCYLAWFIIYDLYLRQNGTLDFILGRATTEVVVWGLRLMGYDAGYKFMNELHYFYNGSKKLLQMVPACNGQVLYPLFIGFIIATPGLLKDKCKVMLVGSVVIFIINALRVLALCLIKINAPQYLAFNHKYTFTVLVYACIFGMWLFWIQYFVPKAVNKV